MKVGILGSGIVGKTLAKGFKKHGHEVMIGTRNVEKLADWLTNDGSGINAGDFAQVAAFGELLVLAIRGENALSALALVGNENLAGKTVIDTTNPIDGQRSPVNGVLHFTTTLDHSLMEELQKNYPQVRFVKAFNSIGSAYMVDPNFKEKPTMFICGNSDDAKSTVNSVLNQFGWEICDMGKAEAARAIEPLCMLWCIRGFNEGKWNHGFKLLVND